MSNGGSLIINQNILVMVTISPSDTQKERKQLYQLQINGHMALLERLSTNLRK
jgi:hypothetical protein